MCLTLTAFVVIEDRFFSSRGQVTYSGYMNGQFSDDLVEMSDCDTSTSPFLLGFSEGWGEPWDDHVNLLIPFAVSVGTHPFWESEAADELADSDYGIVGSLFQGTQWCVIGRGNFVSGTITFKEIPDKSLKRVHGSFETTFTCGDNEHLLNLKGNFTFRTKNHFNADCLKKH